MKKLKIALALALTFVLSVCSFADTDYSGHWTGYSTYDNPWWIQFGTAIVYAPTGNVDVILRGHTDTYYSIYNARIKYNLYYVIPGNPPTYTLVDSNEFNTIENYTVESDPFPYSGDAGYYAVYFYFVNEQDEYGVMEQQHIDYSEVIGS